MAYYGMALNSADLGGDVFLDFFLQAAMDIPAKILVILLLNTTGRKFLMVSSLLIGGVGFLATIFVEFYGGESKLLHWCVHTRSRYYTPIILPWARIWDFSYICLIHHSVPKDFRACKIRGYISDLHTLNTVFALIGKFGSAAAYPVIYVFSAELFPTVVRNAGMGASSCISRIGGMAAPYIADLVCIVKICFIHRCYARPY